MNIEEFRGELKGIDGYEGEWKKYMQMAVNLYKSLGFKTKDVEDNSALKISYNYASGILENIIHPDMQDFYRYIYAKEASENPSQIKSILNSEKTKELLFVKSKKNDLENADIDTFMEELYASVGEIVSSILIKKTSFLSDFMKKYGEKYKDTYLGGLGLNISEIKEELYEFYLNSPDYKKFTEKTFIEEMKKVSKEAEKIMKDGLIYRILVITDFFERTGYLEDIAGVNNSVMQKRGIEPLMVSLTEEKGKFNVKNLLKQEYFRQFSMEELFLFAAHYTNRFEKKFDDLSIGVFLHEKLGTFYHMVEYDELPSKITSDDARVALKQREFLEKKVEVKVKEFLESKDQDSIDLFEVPEEYLKNYEDIYKKYYDIYLPKSNNKNNLTDDYRFIILNQGILQGLYEIKGVSLKAVLYMLAKNKSKFNYGIIREKRKIKNRYGQKQISVGIDCKGFPPIRLHIPEDEYKEYIEEFFDGEEFGDYIGNEDFDINGIEMRTHLLYKYTKDQNKGIKKLYDSLAENSPIFKYVRHIYENIHPSQNPLNTKKEDRKYKPQKSGNTDLDNR